MKSTGLKDKYGKIIYQGNTFKYTAHQGYLLPSFTATVVWMNDMACFGYKRNDAPVWAYPTPFCQHDCLQDDFLNYVELLV